MEEANVQIERINVEVEKANARQSKANADRVMEQMLEDAVVVEEQARLREAPEKTWKRLRIKR